MVIDGIVMMIEQNLVFREVVTVVEVVAVWSRGGGCGGGVLVKLQQA